MNIDHWIKTHQKNFGSPFEQVFVIKVLANVKDLDLTTVSTQYHFKDLDGVNRYCDFVIQEGLLKIAIEIDGYDKRSTGQGMSHDDFVDWQRRQASLTANGWYVLRFANRDVSNEPARCQRYIELLLRDQRSKSQHQASLEEAIERLSHQLKITQGQEGAANKAGSLQREINLLKNQLMLAQNSQPLDLSDRSELEHLIVKLEQEKKELMAARDKFEKEKDILTASNTQLGSQTHVLGGENSTMKTTIWAFTAIISILIVAGVYVSTSANNAPQLGAVATQVAMSGADNRPTSEMQTLASNTLPPATNTTTSGSTPSCDAPIDWNQAKNHADQRVAVRGIVVEYRYLPSVNGSPTWINLGAKYPDKERFSVAVWGDDRSKFGRALSADLVNRQICVIGTVKLREGSPQISLKWPRELVFQ